MILYGHDGLVAAWIAAQIGGEAGFSPGVRALGVVRDGRLVGGVAFDDFKGTDVRLSIAGYGPWLTRALLRAAFGYVFGQLGCRRCTVVVKRTNRRSRALAERIGFREEGALRDAFEDGATAILLGLTRRECRWIGESREPGRVTRREIRESGREGHASKRSPTDG